MAQQFFPIGPDENGNFHAAYMRKGNFQVDQLVPLVECSTFEQAISASVDLRKEAIERDNKHLTEAKNAVVIRTVNGFYNDE